MNQLMINNKQHLLFYLNYINLLKKVIKRECANNFPEGQHEKLVRIFVSLPCLLAPPRLGITWFQVSTLANTPGCKLTHQLPIVLDYPATT